MIASTIGCSAHGWPSPRTNFQHVLRAVCFNFHAVCPQPELLKPCDPWAQEQSKRIWSRYVLLGIYKLSGSKEDTSTLMDYDKDCGEQFLATTDMILQKACGSDEAFLARVRKKIMVLTGDGCPALQKAFKMHVHTILPSVALIIRDACHAIRIATREPVCRSPFD